MQTRLPYRQHKLERIVANIVEQYEEVEKSRSSSVPSRMAPTLQEKRRKVLVQADAEVDEIEPPPEGHSEGMQRAISKDKAALESLVDSMNDADQELLEEVCELEKDELPTTQPLTPATSYGSSEQTEAQASTSTALLRSQDAHTKLEEKLASFQRTSKKPAMVIDVPRMGIDTAGSTNTYFVPLDSTIWTLTDTITNSNGQSFLPDLWSKGKDATRNRATESQLYFEWQDPDEKVMDIINKEGYLGIERVYKEGEYLVALVKAGEEENGFPIDIPRVRRQPASLHLKEIFPDYTVSQVLRLQLGDDASDVMFDKRSFRHQTNPIFVELCSAAENYMDRKRPCQILSPERQWKRVKVETWVYPIRLGSAVQ